MNEKEELSGIKSILSKKKRGFSLGKINKKVQFSIEGKTTPSLAVPCQKPTGCLSKERLRSVSVGIPRLNFRYSKGVKNLKINNFASVQDEEEVKNLERWEQKNSETALNFYIFNLTNSIQAKIMKEDKGPSINLRNINFINKAGGRKKQARTVFRKTPDSPQRIISQEMAIDEQEYFEKHVYMMKEKMLEMFKGNKNIPEQDKRVIETELRKELKELKSGLHFIYQTRKTLYKENNDIHSQMIKLNEEIQQAEIESRRQFIEHKKMMMHVRMESAQDKLMTYMVEKDRLRHLKENLSLRQITLKTEWDSNKENLEQFEQKTEIIKRKISLIKGILKDYYISLLKQGTDTRGRGLIWIIQKLQKLQVVIGAEIFPFFLRELMPEVQSFLEELAKEDHNYRSMKKQAEHSKRSILRMALQEKEMYSTRNHNTPCKLQTRTIERPTRSNSSSRQIFSRMQINRPSLIPRGFEDTLEEKELSNKKYQIEQLKLVFAARLGKYLAAFVHHEQKVLLPKFVAALFGEQRYEVEIIKQIQIAKKAAPQLYPP